MKPMNFTLKQLRYFAVAGEHQSVTKAAELLYVSQPSISSAILHLEDVTGLKLFVRHHAQGLSLTPQGVEFYRKARNLLQEAESLAQFASSLSTEITGTLKVAGFPTVTGAVLPRILKGFMDKYPSVYVDCRELHQKNLIEGIQNCDYELGITYDMELPASISFEPLVSLPPYAVVSTDHPLANRRSVSMAELAEQPLVMLDWPVSRQYFMSLFISLGLKPNCAFRTHSLSMARGMVANGLGYSLLNMPMSGDSSSDHLVALPIEEPLVPLALGVARLQDTISTPAAAAFIDDIKQYVAEFMNDNNGYSMALSVPPGNTNNRVLPTH
ncbi:LysR family transcriptional regulator [Oceanobacter mangrovi]|uniref:LysR family transcriptional regulator n=1 Tax=Oceanobacter mangrovi TaxID=2862510 RepID=UPI001FE33A22|nr:LysR family transcriptional regulator [Oceanobacter mangrovi]